MNRDLMKYVNGEVRPWTKEERQVAAEAKQLALDVRMAGLKVDGALSLAGHAMEGAVGLDDHRVNLSKGDPIRSLLLADLEETAMQQVKTIQRQLFDQWGL